MRVKKRNGNTVDVNLKLLHRYLENIVDVEPKLTHVKVKKILEKVENAWGEYMESSDIPNLVAETAAGMTTEHHHYAKLAGRSWMSGLHKETFPSFTQTMLVLSDILHPDFVANIKTFNFDDTIVHERDFQYDIFACKTLERSYLLRKNNVVVERPQYMLMRVSIAVAMGRKDKPFADIVKENYEAMSKLLYTHATPTLFHAGMEKQQLASCYLMTMKGDSVAGIYDTLKDCALISKGAGGIGLSISQIRPSGSNIAGTNGVSNGLTPMLKVFNDTARYIDQCVTPNTIVYTTDGPKQISSLVNETDFVINTNGAERIQNVLEHPYNDKILTIKTLHSIEPLVITPEHPVFILRDLGKGYNYTHTKERISNGRNVPGWVDAKDVSVRDFIGFPIPKYEKDVASITEEDCYFYGLLLGDGTLENGKSYGKITLHTVNKAYILDWLKSYFNNRFIQYNITVDDNTTRIRWNKATVLPIKHGDVYRDKEKHVGSKWLNLPISKSKFIVKGLIDTDGCVQKEIVFDSTSRHMIESMRYILMRMGILTSGYVRDRRGQSHTTARGVITNKKIAYCLRLPKLDAVCDLLNIERSGRFTKFFEHDGIMYSRVQSIDIGLYDGTLYDLQMVKEHVYVTHNGMIHNGGGKRKGSFAMWLEPWHPDVFEFLDLKKNHGDENRRARDLFYGLWIPDLFMKRVKSNGSWSMFCPNKCKGLQDTHGEEFEALYTRYESEGKAHATVDARELWLAVCDSQIETGTPYLMYKDAVNAKSNQSNLGTIRASNLCCEISIYTSPEEVGVCTLASLSLPKCMAGKRFEHSRLERITRLAVRNLDSVVDINCYPIPEAENSNKKNRPIGIGVQGLADVFQTMNLPYDSAEALQLNTKIFETIYYAAVSESIELAKELGPYETFQGSPASKGLLQFDLWGVVPSRSEWKKVKTDLQRFGMRNSLLVAPMPTASTAQILGNTESFEPRTTNLYTRRVLAGEYMVINPILQDRLMTDGLWDNVMAEHLIANRGSIQNTDLPKHIKNVYKTVWELSQKALINLSAARGPYVCQSQSLNLYLQSPTRAKLSSMAFYAWEKGLKTGQYYLRSQPDARAIQFTVCKKKQDDEEPCIMCSS